MKDNKSCSGGHCCCDTPIHVHKHSVAQALPWKTYLPAIISFVMLVSGILFSYFNLPFFQTKTVQFIWYLISYLLVGIPVLKEAIESFRKKDIFNEFSLMTIATIGAFYIGEYPEGVAVMLFYSVGEYFQEAAVKKATRNISALLDVRPDTATVVDGETAQTLSPEEVKTGQIIEVKTGERVPLDGELLTPNAAFNTAALTGESVPQTKQTGETVLAGMIAADKVVRIKVTKPYDQSVLSRILELVQNATEKKAPTEKFIRKFARIYTPIVVGLAFLIVLAPFLYSLINADFTYLFNDWLYRGLIFLVISCPCALVISIPLGYFGGIGAASRAGILFKGSNYLDIITQINVLVSDKTGTLTKGVFDVQKVEATNHSTEELLSYVASLESHSNHPIAQAVVSYAQKQSINIDTPQQVEEIAGKGLKGIVNGKTILAGNAKLLELYNIEYPQEVKDIIETTVLCAIDGQWAGYLIVADQPKDDALQAIQDLKREGIKRIIMLSGDKDSLVQKTAAELGITEAYGNLLPEDKAKHIEELKKDPANKVAYIGDGINDAPVLVMSDVGIAMGALGSDAAIETADIVIQTDEPSRITTAMRIGKATRRIVWQNIILAFSIKLIVMILGVEGVANLWEAVFADVGVALLAILNAVRLQHMKFK